MAYKRSFFERLTGAVKLDEEKELFDEKTDFKTLAKPNVFEESEEEAQLTVDVYQTPSEIIIKTMVAGVKPEDLELSIARDMVTIQGKREESRIVNEDNYFSKELYWGKFSRVISLPQEVEPEEAEATEKHGLLTIRLQKVNKDKKNNVKVKSI